MSLNGTLWDWWWPLHWKKNYHLQPILAIEKELIFFKKIWNKNVISIEKGCKWPLLIANNNFFHNVVAHNKWELLHLDVKMSFLNNDLKEDVFMNQSKGFQVEGQEQAT